MTLVYMKSELAHSCVYSLWGFCASWMANQRTTLFNGFLFIFPHSYYGIIIKWICSFTRLFIILCFCGLLNVTHKITEILVIFPCSCRLLNWISIEWKNKTMINKEIIHHQNRSSIGMQLTSNWRWNRHDMKSGIIWIFAH